MCLEVFEVKNVFRNLKIKKLGWFWEFFDKCSISHRIQCKFDAFLFLFYMYRKFDIVRWYFDAFSTYHWQSIEIPSKCIFLTYHRKCIELNRNFDTFLTYHRQSNEIPSKCIFSTYHRNTIENSMLFDDISMLFRWYVEKMHFNVISMVCWKNIKISSNNIEFFIHRKSIENYQKCIKVALKFQWRIGKSFKNSPNQPKFLISKLLNAFLISENLQT